MSQIRIYAISGLGADESVFANLRQFIDLEVIAWKKNKPAESLQDYAKRMADDIDAKEPFILLGLSFGGVLAQEISHFLKPEKLILLSSLRHENELQTLIKLIKKAGIVEHLPLALFRPPLPLCKWYFGTDDTTLVKDLIDRMDLELVKWSIIQLLNWKSKPLSLEPIRIHGTADRLLYYQKDAMPIEGGGHFMVHDRAGEVHELLSMALSS